MRSTLFLIPHELAGVPLFGFGWLLGILSLAGIGWLIYALSKKQPVGELLGALPVWLIAAGIVTFVLPQVELKLPDGTALGLPIRGYGVMVLLGLLAGVGITIHRGQQLGIAADNIIGLGFWMMLGGILGARGFYVIQKWDSFAPLGFTERLIDIVKLTEGGLVIYGGVIGGLVAGAIFCGKHRMEVLATADLIAPGFLIGLSLGRIGCLLHGCCFGGVCTVTLPAIVFPQSSAPYNFQLQTGELLGLQLEGQQASGKILAVANGSPAAAHGLQVGQHVDSVTLGLSGESTISEPDSLSLRVDVVADGQRYTFLPSQLPPSSLPVHPSQIYASINALLLCLLIWKLQPLPSRDGAVFMVAILLYATSRFLLEGVRSDEAGQFGTPFTISQLIAFGSGVAAVIGLVLLKRQPLGRVWIWPQSAF